MLIDREVTWDIDILPCWRRSANNAMRPNSDVWRPLPPTMRWYEAHIDGDDIANLFLIGSSDLCKTFGSYRVADIKREFDGEDSFKHKSRIRSLVSSVQHKCELERPILVSESMSGPFVIIDGNHRCLAYYACNHLVGLSVYLGMCRDLLSTYAWARQALQHRRASV